MQRHHLAKVTVVKGVYGVESESRGEYPIERRWAPTSLYVSKNGGASFFAGALGDLGLQEISDPRETHVAERIHLTISRWQRAL